MTRLVQGMTSAEVFLTITEANVGASDMISDLVDLYKAVDPQVPSSIIYLQLFDSLGLYGSDLYDYWRQTCDQRTEVLLAILHFYREGRLTKESVLGLRPNQAEAILRRASEMNSRFLPFLASRRIKA